VIEDCPSSARVNRAALDHITELGCVPVDVQTDALKVSRPLPIAEAAKKLPQTKDYPPVRGGATHRWMRYRVLTCLNWPPDDR
jgi:hypothetical protein